MENGFEKSKNMTTIDVDYKFTKFVTYKIMVTKMFATNFIVNQIYWP